MNTRIVFVLLAAIVALGAVPGRAHAQDALAMVKGLYESADYEEALRLLETLKGRTANTETSAYRVFCLMALGRRDEARAAVETIVREDPLYRPGEGQVSPRLRAFFEEARKPLLPEVARQSYASAKAAFDARSWGRAIPEFDRVIALLEEVGDADPGATDLRTLATGFRDLAKASAEPPPAPKPEPTPVPAPAPAKSIPAEPEIFGEEHDDVKRPISVSKVMPNWVPANASEERGVFVGALELVIDELGRVIFAKLIDSVHPRYDSQLLKAATSWTFRPATRNGTSVKYRYTMAVQLGK